MGFYESLQEEEGLTRRAVARVSESRWTLATAVATVLTGLALRGALTRGWRYARHEDPPFDPTDEDVDWADALFWAAISGLVVAIGRVVARRGVGELRRRRRGRFR